MAKLFDDSPIVKRLAWQPPPEDPMIAHQREAKRRMALALRDAFDGAPPEGRSVEMPRTATAEELHAEAVARTEHAASVAGAKTMLDEAAKLRAEADKLERKLRGAESRERVKRLEAQRVEIEREMDRIRARRAERGKKELRESELRGRAAAKVARGGR